jgi:hypothetical protein
MTLLMALLLLSALAVMAMASDEIVKASQNDLNQMPQNSKDFYQQEINPFIYYPATANTKPTTDTPIVLDAPANDNCANAEIITGSGAVSYTTVEATIDGPLDYINAPNVWFIYNSTFTGLVQITLSDTGSEYMNSRPRCAIYDGISCPEPVIFPDTIELRGGEDMPNASDIGALPKVIIGDLYNYDQDFNFSSCSYYFYGGGTIGDVVYSYTATDNDTINVEFEGGAQLPYDPLLVIVDSNGNEVACTRTASGIRQLWILGFPVTVGQTYYIVISNLNGIPDRANFTLKVYSPNYEFISFIPDWGNVERINFLAVAGQQYLMEIGAGPISEDVNCAGYLTVTENPRVPENDNCENATQGDVLQPGTTIQLTGDNRGAPSIDCPQISIVPEVWATFEIEETQTIALDLCGTSDEFNSSYLYLTKDCPCNPYNIQRSSSYLHMRSCNPPELRIYFNNIQPGRYWFPIASGYESEEEYVLNIRSITPETCNDYSLFGQEPPSSDVSQFTQSDNHIETAIAEDFSGLDAPISRVTLWGMMQNGNGFCTPDSFPVSIVFFNSNSGAPGDTVAVFNVNASVEETGHVIINYYPQLRFSVDLNYPVSLSEGWMMIRGISEDNCAFFWEVNNSVGGYCKVYNTTNHRWTTSSYDYAFCLDSLTTDAINDGSTEIPAAFELYQNYPNPFNSRTSIQFVLKDAGDVSLSVYDIAGALVKNIYSGYLSEGSHTLIWDGKNESGVTASSGSYFYRLKDSKGTLIKSMILLK